MMLLISSLALAEDISFDPKLDIPLATLALGSYYFMKDQTPRDILGVANPQGVDAWGAPRWNNDAIVFSDFMGHPLKFYGCNGPILSSLALGLGMGLQNGAQQGLIHSFVVMEAVAINVSITQGLKLLISRPRPFTSLAFQEQYSDEYNGAYIQEELENHDAWLSMPSGHTSTAAATYMSIATLLAFHYPQHRYWFYGGATILTGITGGARVVAGMHHPTDVLVGGVLGASIGYGVAKLHTRSESNVQATLSPNVFMLNGVW